jgi:hypothetical protein
LEEEGEYFEEPNQEFPGSIREEGFRIIEQGCGSSSATRNNYKSSQAELEGG